jgi:hypothetical protein
MDHDCQGTKKIKPVTKKPAPQPVPKKTVTTKPVEKFVTEKKNLIFLRTNVANETSLLIRLSNASTLRHTFKSNCTLLEVKHFIDQVSYFKLKEFFQLIF